MSREEASLPVAFQVAMVFTRCLECGVNYAVVKDHTKGRGGAECDVDAVSETDFCPFCGEALL